MQSQSARPPTQTSVHGFTDRREAGRVLAEKLAHHANKPDVMVLALPRGGVPVAFEVAKALRAPLDVFLVKKIGVPGFEELALGAVASGGMYLLNLDLAAQIGLTSEAANSLAATAYEQLKSREDLYRADLPRQALKGRTVILVDDGLATGSSMQAAVSAVRRFQPARIVVAAPVAAQETCQELRGLVDEVVCARTPDPFFAVGAWYNDFEQTTDEEVIELLHQAAAKGVGMPNAATP